MLGSKVNRRRFLKYAGASVVAGAAAIGGYYLYRSSMPRPSGWTYVALGDCWTQDPSYVAYYAGHIEADLGVKVSVHNEGKSGLRTKELASALRSDQQLRNEISEANVVTFLIGNNDVRSIVFNNGNLFPDIRKALAPWRENFEAVIKEILSLRSTSDTIIRTSDCPLFCSVEFLKKVGEYDQVKANAAYWSEQVAEAASKYNIPVARTFLAMNGPNGDEDPEAKGYTINGADPNDAGDRLIAELLRKLGYKPLGP
jgi:hypothetical protein